MTVVTDLFRRRWRSGEHVGDAKPAMKVYSRRVVIHRGYWEWTGPEEFDGVTIPGETAEHPFHPILTGPSAQGHLGPFPPWEEIPQVLQAEIEQTFEENGVNRLTLTADDTALQEEPSPLGGIYHAVKRGYLAPWRNFTPAGRPRPWPVDEDVPYDGEKLWNQTQIRVDQGYGDETPTTFSGAVDDLDYSSSPDQMVLAARDFGQLLVDSRIVGWNKSKQLPDPLTFIDRDKARRRELVGAAFAASSSAATHPKVFATDGNRTTTWRSAGHHDADELEWIEITLAKEGSYDQIRLDCELPDEDLYVGIFAHHFESGASPRRNGVAIDGGWVDSPEGGDVPTEGIGTFPYVRHYKATRPEPTYLRLDAEYRLGAGSRIRLGFKNLQKASDGLRRATVREAKAVRRVLPTADPAAKKWILISDVSDVVRVILRWAGFKEWIVEDTGITLPVPLVVNRGDFYIDVIKKMQEITGYVFFMGDPTGPDSMGVPTFRQAGALRERNAPELQTGRPKPLRQIRDIDLLTAASVKFTDEPLSYLIRIRGKPVSREKGGRTWRFGGDVLARYEYSYYPPWTREGRMPGFLKYFLHTYNHARSNCECEMACFLVAIQQALASATAVVQIPGNPEFCLDDHIYLVEQATGLQTRLWAASRSSTFKTGEDASWTMTLGGALIDTPDVVAVKVDIAAARKNAGRCPPPPVGHWQRPTTRPYPVPVEPIAA